MTKILILVDWFDPAYKAGGPVRSCVNLVKALETYFEIYVLTSDSDIDGELTEVSRFDEWLPYSRYAKVMYLSTSSRSLKKIEEVCKAVRPDTIILNSLYSRTFSLYPLLLKKFGKIKSQILIFPRGMLKPSALKHKSTKKRFFFLLARSIFAARNNIFVATDANELREIEHVFPGASCRLAANFSDNTVQTFQTTEKDQGFVKMIFVGRVHPIKNLKYLLEIIADSMIRGSLSIIGVMEDKLYWKECSAVIEKIRGVKIDYLGELPHEKLYKHIADSHLFVLPTLGENYGHAIAESLSMGRPLLISDQTPWRNLQKCGLGWDHPLSDRELFKQSLLEAENWTGEEFDKICWNCYSWYTKGKSEQKLIEEYKNILEYVPIGN